MYEMIFLIQRADAKELLADITGFFYERGFNILDCRHHTDSYAGRYFMKIGSEIERSVLSRAVQAHLDHMVMVDSNKTVVFEN